MDARMIGTMEIVRLHGRTARNQIRQRGRTAVDTEGIAFPGSVI
jgi:hypothetical protein